jgi:hypothetical protein
VISLADASGYCDIPLGPRCDRNVRAAAVKNRDRHLRDRRFFRVFAVSARSPENLTCRVRQSTGPGRMMRGAVLTRGRMDSQSIPLELGIVDLADFLRAAVGGHRVDPGDQLLQTDRVDLDVVMLAAGSDSISLLR